MDIIVTLQCQDQPGIVHAMTSSVLACDGNIIENQQFTDPVTKSFVMRTRFETAQTIEESQKTLQEGLGRFKSVLKLRPVGEKKRALIMVTSESHCLRDLLYLQELNELPIEIPAVVSNHESLRALVESHGIPFHFIDVRSLGKSESEVRLQNIVDEEEIDFLVLARYMQILSSDFCSKLQGSIINIHHSFLPGFKGAKPYHQAHDRGVKIIGATAHFVTADLDEGPIIEQDIAHTNHTATPEDMIALGRDVERRVLSRAVKLFAEDRIFVVGNRTIVL